MEYSSMNDLKFTTAGEYVNTLYDERHGGPYDRGSADSYYGRAFAPHYFVGSSYNTEKIELREMTVEEIVAYTKGYKDNEESGSHKEW